ncbi:amino acid ABC transporter permease [Terrarubrum flagellatum]|uniref:amino acid ABC transporter permease n=1 Tax=Terrirubrum flagellatum TaxID=2895980 RepID=UPI0031455E13
MSLAIEGAPQEKASLLYDPKVRGIAWQVILFVIIGFVVYEAYSNAVENLQKAKIASGFGFWDVISGFDIGQHLIDYSAATGTYGRAFWVGLLNTLLVAVIGCVLATFLGFTVGVARLSHNWVVAKIATVYVELIRNVPLLLQLLIWYNAVLKPLPNPRDSFKFFGDSFALNNRGLYVPEPTFLPAFSAVSWTLLGGILASILFRLWAKKQQALTGRQYPIGLVALALIVVLPGLVFLVMGRPVEFSYPALQGFNLRGGTQIYPEFVALLVGLVTYTAAFIAEIVRAGILSVSKGQTEAAHALGIRNGPTLKLVIIPQALRVIIPPLTSNYLNLTKNSSLAVAIGYPDLVQVFMGTVLNQTGQAIEVIAITMLVYLTISLTTATFMNWYNSRKALVER